MKNLFQNKFMIVLLVISVLLVGTTSFISALGYTSYVRNAIGIALTPVQKGFNSFFDNIEETFSAKKKYREVKKENDLLKEELANQADIIARAKQALEENEELKEYLGIKEEHIDCTFENAKITGRQANTYTTVYTVDKGSYHGIEPGMPVIDKFGIIGCVSEVGLTWSKVTPITEPDLSLGVTVERTGESGVCSGSFNAAKNSKCVLSYVSDKADLKQGDRIITSDESSLYPKGILVGIVDSTETNALSRETIAYIIPAADLKNAESVMIITDFEGIYE